MALLLPLLPLRGGTHFPIKGLIDAQHTRSVHEILLMLLHRTALLVCPLDNI